MFTGGASADGRALGAAAPRGGVPPGRAAGRGARIVPAALPPRGGAALRWGAPPTRRSPMTLSMSLGQRAGVRAHARQASAPGSTRPRRHAAAKKFDVECCSARGWRPTCCRFASQVQIACDAAKCCVARLAGVDAPKCDDDEAHARRAARAGAPHRRLRRSRCRAAQIDGSEAREVTVPRRDGAMTMQGRGLPEARRAAQLLLPRHHGLRAAAPQRRRARQARLPRPAEVTPRRR